MHLAPYVVWAGFDRANYAMTRGKPMAFRADTESSGSRTQLVIPPSLGATTKKETAMATELRTARRDDIPACGRAMYEAFTEIATLSRRSRRGTTSRRTFRTPKLRAACWA